MQTQESKIDTGKAVDADLVVTESSGTESEVQDDSSRSGNDTEVDDADIRPIYYKEPMAKVQLTTKCNIFGIEQQHTEQLEISHEGRVDQFNAQSFQHAMICNMDSIGKYMLEIILHQQRTAQLLKQKKLTQTQDDHSNPILALNVDSLKVDLVVIQNTCSKKEDSNLETASSKSGKESILDYATKDIQAIKYKMSKAKERCMAYFRSIHSHLQVLSKQDLNATRIEHRFKQAFMSLFGQDAETFTSTMLLNVDQLQKQLDIDEFLEDGSMASFWLDNNILGNLKSLMKTTSLLANNADLKAQIQEKVFAIATLKNDLMKLKRNSVDTKCGKTSVLEKLVLQSLKKTISC
nr:hypothetical protein [Tanacetum cinerariifolium]